ncbi:MAG: LysR family transcriptional regulator [Oscillospiraceae bacterium]|nr:LysR family transcriptional regulator [Oscillospiraceae bacterium]
MYFSQIKCFLAAADCLSFTKAADRLYLSQPVLSRQIAGMEEELGIELFVREKKSVRLTAAGETMRAGLSQLAEEYTALVERAMAQHKGYVGRLNIGMIEGQLICPPYSVALNRFREKYPDVQVNLSKHTLSGLLRALSRGDIDIAFNASFELNDEDEFEYIEVGSSKTMLVVPRSHPLVGRQGLTLDDFRDDTFLSLPESESPYIAASQRSRAERMDATHKTLEAPNIGALALWLEAGYGIFPLNSNHSLRNDPNLVFLDIPGLGSATEIVMWKKSEKNPMIKLFVSEFDPID